MKQNLHTHTVFCDGEDTPEAFIKEAIAKTGENITVRQFKRIELGVTE